MARDPNRQDLHDAFRHENWSLQGPSRIVKVQAANAQTSRGHVGGYITLAKYIKGMTPDRIEKALGLKLGSLASGAVIYDLARRPMPSEYEYELTAGYPGGLAYTFMSSRDYPPGSPRIQQWAVNEGTQIPVAARITLKPGQPFPG